MESNRLFLILNEIEHSVTTHDITLFKYRFATETDAPCLHLGTKCYKSFRIRLLMNFVGEEKHLLVYCLLLEEADIKIIVGFLWTSP